MTLARRLRRWAWTVGFYGPLAVNGIGFTLGFFLPLWLLSRVWPGSRRFLWWWTRWMFRSIFAGLTALGAMRIVEFRGLDRLRRGEPGIYVANHRSLVDVLLILARLPDATCLLKSIQPPPPDESNRSTMPDFWKPFILAPFSLTGYIPMPASARDREALMETYRRCRDALLAGRPLVIFPEGTRSTDGHLLPFQDFPFKLAAETRLPVIPMAIVSDVPFMPKGTHAVDPARRALFRIAVLDPIPWRPGTRASDLSWEARRRIQKQVAEFEAPQHDPNPSTSS